MDIGREVKCRGEGEELQHQFENENITLLSVINVRKYMSFFQKSQTDQTKVSNFG